MSSVYVFNVKEKKYPRCSPFHPSIAYPEYPFSDVSQEENKVYDAIRQLFVQMELDKENYNTKNWNPLGKYIKKGAKVLLKPNIVNHVNQCLEGTLDCVITNGSIIRAILDYVYIAVGREGKIMIGDAPIQQCDFDKATKANGLQDIVSFYQENEMNIILSDFRHGSSIEVDLKQNSMFTEIMKKYKKFTVTNYDPRQMKRYHNSFHNIYFIVRYAMEADVIINLPKPKSHRKAGMTGALKNFIGVNANKDCLPHHTKGSIKEGGDEYLKVNTYKKVNAYLYDRFNVSQFTHHSFQTRLYSFFIRKLKPKLEQSDKDGFSEGSWYGNDTIWRTICDINKIVMYGRLDGTIGNEKERVILNLGDMIVAGEKEGPLAPSAKPLGYLIFSDDLLAFDLTIAYLMGFDFHKIKYLNYLADYYQIGPDNIDVISNELCFHQKKLSQWQKEDTFLFEPSAGFKNHIEL